MLRAEPGLDPVVTRRRVLIGGVALAALAIATPACSSPPAPPTVDELEAQLNLARQDSELATAAAVGASERVNRALKQVATERSQHAEALNTEIQRLAATSSATTSPTTTTASAAAAPPPPLASVVTSLKASADSARQLATTSSGYRAGLLGSIAASCTASYTVALAFEAAAS
jgi:hypothetical protein